MSHHDEHLVLVRRSGPVEEHGTEAAISPSESESEGQDTPDQSEGDELIDTPPPEEHESQEQTGWNDTDVYPAWGTLPIEPYLINHWHEVDDEDGARRAKVLIQRYISGGSPKETLLDSPTQDQINNILLSFRTVGQRSASAKASEADAEGASQGVLWLRTCYDEDLAEVYDELFDTTEHEVEDATSGESGGKDRIFDDKALWDFGKNWRRIFDIMPELLGGNEQYPKSGPSPEKSDMEYAAEDLRNLVEYLQSPERRAEDRPEDIDFKVQYADRPYYEREDYEKGKAWDAEADLANDLLNLEREPVLVACVTTKLYVVDKRALRTSLGLMVYADGRGRAVKMARVPPEFVQESFGSFRNYVDSEWFRLGDWREAMLGEDYKPGGPCSGLLVGEIRDECRLRGI